MGDKTIFVNAIMQIYLVGGAVRDGLLKYPSKDRDWVVVGATPQAMKALGYTSVGKDFPVFMHPDTKEEYALARKERKTSPGYTGFIFDTDPHVSLEEDLLRRDLTINAIAQTEDGTLVDPFDGIKDIDNKVLRHVSDAFKEDPVRILRIARFMARYHDLGFTIAESTFDLMRTMVANGEVNHLTAERVWQELDKALGERAPEQFIKTLRSCGALKVIMPELDALFGIPQPEKHHPEIDTGVHTLMTLKQATLLSDSRPVRFASLLHDLGKACTDPLMWPKHHSHEKLGIAPINALCDRLHAPNEYRELALICCEYHTLCHTAFALTAKTLFKLLAQTDAYRRPLRFALFTICCKADARGRTGFELDSYAQADYLLNALRITLEIDVNAFIRSGLKGKAIGDAIKQERFRILKEYVESARKTAANSNPET